jgi:hypothetical protein
MGKVTPAPTPGAVLAGERLDAAIESAVAGHLLYPSGTSFVGADVAWLGETVARCARKRTPVLIVYPDGEERLLLPS